MRDKIQLLFASAHLLLPAFLATNEYRLGGRKGIYLAIHETDQGHSDEKMIYGEVIGELPADKIAEKEAFAAEKIIRMKANVEIASLLSENEDAKQFGGGIRATNVYIAPSGFPPHLDQEFAILLALLHQELSVEDYAYIKASTSDRVEYWKEKNGELG